MKKIFGLLVLLAGFGSSSVVSAQELNYTPATNMSIDPDNSPEAQALQACIPPEYISLGCGCWGSAMEGQLFPSPTCCSGRARAWSCPGYCYRGGFPYRLVCTW